MKNLFYNIIALSRYEKYLFSVIVTTLLGTSTGNGTFGWKLFIIIAANLLVVSFAFMINDVEDADDDAVNPAKVNRNPVSAGRLSSTLGYLVSFGAAILAFILFLYLGGLPLYLGLMSLILSFLYSWKMIRLKALPFVDMICHCLMLAGLQYLIGFTAFSPQLTGYQWFWPFLCVTSISIYGELHNEIRDLKYDKKVGLTHTAGVLGRRKTFLLLTMFLSVGLIGAVMTATRILHFSILTLLIFFATLLVLSVRSILSNPESTNLGFNSQEYFHQPIETAAAISLFLQMIIK